MKIIFLDIDGVLNQNNGKYAYNDECGSTGIDPNCVNRLNKILKKTRAKIVIISAWRYMIIRGAMEIKGFSYLLQTHGLLKNRIFDYIAKDLTNSSDDMSRGLLISQWVEKYKSKKLNKIHRLTHYVVIDDKDLGISAQGHPFIQTNPITGLTDENVEEAINILKKGM